MSRSSGSTGNDVQSDTDSTHLKAFNPIMCPTGLETNRLGRHLQFLPL
ncbi:hypothetical protein SynPROSU1_01403 [Synechococcus sp. PROS-U-1]|nr:hypothetical protein SynPROSU1_01403 [Synechococcus sp. PROS-U-1]